MLDRLETAEILRTRARRTIVSAAALASALLAPLVDELILGEAFGHGRMDGGEVLGFGAWGALAGAALGGLTMWLGLRAAGAAHVVWIAMLAGILYLPLLLLGGLIPTVAAGGPSDLLAMLGGLLVATIVGAIASGPAGLCFGLVFVAGLAEVHGHLETPSQETPIRAVHGAARLFGAATLASLLLACALEGSFCQLVFFVLLPSVGIEAAAGTDIAWTRFVILPAPFALAALVTLARGAWLDRRMRLTVEALRRGEHPRWVLGELDEGGLRSEVVPLRHDDGARRESALLVHARDAQAPYRGRGRVVTLLGP